MKLNAILFILTVIPVLCSCTRNKKPKSTDRSYDSTSIKSAKSKSHVRITGDTTGLLGSNKLDTISCDSLLTLLVETSSLDKKYIQGFKVQQDDVSDGILKIKITNKNEEGNDIALVWLDLDLKKKLLNDVTPDADKPIKLKYDTIIFNKILEKCRLIE
jgi:hypothetical protein